MRLTAVRGDLPIVAKRVGNHRAPVSIRRVLRFFTGDGAGFQRTLVRGVGIIDVEVQKSRHRFTRSGSADHDDRVADLDLRRRRLYVLSGRRERAFEKVDQLGGILHDESRGNVVPAFG